MVSSSVRLREQFFQCNGPVLFAELDAHTASASNGVLDGSETNSTFALLCILRVARVSPNGTV